MKAIAMARRLLMPSCKGGPFQMHKFRESLSQVFPVVLIVSWMVAAAFTLSLTIEVPDRRQPEPASPSPAVVASEPLSW